MEKNTYSTYDVRLRAVRAVTSGESVGWVARAYQVAPSTLHRWVNRHRLDGEEGLQRKQVEGRPRKINQPILTKLKKLILEPASEFGFETDFWTCRRMMIVAKSKLRVNVSQPTMWRMLRSLDLTYQKPERIYHEGRDQAREEWIRREVPKIRKCVKKHRAILYFEDESNVSLTASLGKSWSPRGKTPVAKVTGRRGGVAAMSAISGSGRLAFTLLERRIASAEVIHFLAQLLREHSRRHLVVVMDQASPHTSAQTQAFINSQPRLHVFYLPKYSPKFNPDEYVWNHLKHQELKWHQARDKKALAKLTEKKLRSMSQNPELLRGLWFRCCIAELMN